MEVKRQARRILTNFAITAFFNVLLIPTAYILYNIYDQNTTEETTNQTLEHFVEMDLTTPLKDVAGQITNAKIIGDKFLHERFPNWKENKKTYMVPPVFQAHQSVFQTGVAECVQYSDPGDNGEGIVYNLLQKLGDDEGMGMFIIHGFVLKDIGTWNKKYKDNQVPESKSATGESDFIIFHHQLGVIAIEVKNLSKARNKKIVDAEIQLEKSLQLLLSLTKSTDSDANSNSLSIPFKKVIALPSTKKTDFNRAEFHGLGEDRLLLFEDNCQNFPSFREWWFETIESATKVQMSAETSAEYEKALSYILMIRHMSPVVETEYIAKIYQSLVNYKYNYKDAADSYFSQIDENTYPFFSSWCWNVFNEKNEKGSSLSKNERKRLQISFLKSNKLISLKYEEKEGKETLMKFLDEFLRRSKNKYINGDQFTLTDDAISALFDNTYVFGIKNILKFYVKMRKMWPEIKHQDSETYSREALEARPFLKLDSAKHVRDLERHLSDFSFIEEGEKPTEVDKKLFESLTCKMRLKHAHQPIVMTSEQLVVFEGPKKQLLIGPPGSGKTELMKFKALEQHDKMKTCKTRKKIMYILANGSPSYRNRNSLFFYHIKEFFNKSNLVDVISIVVEEESEEDTEHTASQIRKKISSGEYEHAFIDEYWIGSKPLEHKIILKLVREIPGYVWISSVFDYNRNKIEHDTRMIERTQPLLTVLEEKKGVVSNLTQVMRPTNKIIELLREYSKLYKDRSYPYGTQNIFGHSYEGLPVTWAVEKNVNEMYKRCVDLVTRAVTTNAPMPIKDTMENEKLILDPADILIVDFAVRMNESSQPKQSLQDRLTNNDIQVSTFEESLEDFMKCKTGKVTLLQAAERDISEFVDGVEWPMVIVILPSSLVVQKPKKIRNYDPYISFFRTMVKLVVISDLWKNKDEFLSDIAKNV